MKWYRLVPVILMGVLLLGSMMTPPALAQSSNTLQDNVPGSFLVFPIFDIFSSNETKIRITCNGVSGTWVRLTYICQPFGTSNSSLFCPSFDERYHCTPHQTVVFDLDTQIGGNCPTGQGYVVAFAEDQCTPASPATTCATATGGTIQEGEYGPISYNQLFGSYHLYYHGFEFTTVWPGTPSAQQCGVVGAPCSPLAAGPNPDVEAANAIAIQSQQPSFSFLGNDTGGALQLTFGTTTAFDYVALPKVVGTDFATPGSDLSPGPSDFPPFIPEDGAALSSGLVLETNIILLNLNYTQFLANAPAAMSVNAWNWREVGFTSTHRFICWERVPINYIDTRIVDFAGLPAPFDADYGNIRFTPSPLAGASSAQLLGAIEEVTNIGRYIRNMIHSSSATSPAIFITDIEF